MMRKRILLLRLSPIEANDSANIGIMGLAKGLTKLGCTLDFLTIPAIDHTNESFAWGCDFIKQINVFQANRNIAYDAVVDKGGRLKDIGVYMLRKLYHSLSLYDYTYSIAEKINISLLPCTSYDLVISCSDPKSSHIAVKNLLRQGLRCKIWLQYWGDPMALDITRRSIYPIRYVAREEKNILSGAHKIVYVSPFTLDAQKSLFSDISDRMHFLPIPYLNEKLYCKPANKKFTIGYFGAYYNNIRNILPLYNACINLKEGICLNIAGDTNISLVETENIKIYPRMNVSGFEEKSDLLVCILNKKGTQIPGKIYYIAATNRPALVILDGDNKEKMREYLGSFKRFILCDNSIEDIESKIRMIMLDNKTYKPAPQFSAEMVAENILKIAFEK